MGKLNDLTGQRFGRLVVIGRLPKSENYKCYTAYPNGGWRLSSFPKWLCKCDCGNEVAVIGCNLKSGQTQSCGCLMRDKLKERNRKRST